jgi:hypothetical protein
LKKRDAQALGQALLGNARGAQFLAPTCLGRLWSVPAAGAARTEARMLARDAKYALTCDLAMGLLGDKLKRMELSARLGDCLSHLYMGGACVLALCRRKETSACCPWPAALRRN